MDYGVLRATPIDFGREDNDPKSPHFQIVARAGEVRWRIPVNVKSSAAQDANKALVLFHLQDPLSSAALLDRLTALPEGFHAKQQGLAMDYLREALFNLPDMKAVKFSEPGENDDVQDILEVHVKRAMAGRRPVFAFGARFDATVDPRPPDKKFQTTMGVHDIHMNQGNPKGGGHEGDNGVFQDGGLLIQLEDRWIGFFIAFQSQLVPTDAKGFPAPGAKPIGAAGPGPVPAGAVKIIAAMVNPLGVDTGFETVTLINVSASDTAIAGWRLVDKIGQADVLAGSIAAGETLRVRLSGTGAQLGNNGGSIRLEDAAGTPVSSVTYGKDAASVQGVTLVFG